MIPLAAKLVFALLLFLYSDVQAISLDPSLWRISFSSSDVGVQDPQHTGPQNPHYPIGITGDITNCLHIKSNQKYIACVNAAATGWYFDFPKLSTAGHVNYITTAGTVAGASSITIHIKVLSNVASPIFHNLDTQCAQPADVRLMFGWDISSQPYGRWWSNPLAIQLALGDITITVPLVPASWSSVFGEYGDSRAASLVGFQDAVNRNGFVGMTFGCEHSFGHGVSLDDVQAGHELDSAQFQLLGYTLNP